MAERQGGVLVQLRKLLDTQTAKDQTDGQLLARFAAQRDESAFAALMQRHGPLVYNVCRHMLGHEQDAEDAFQGTFLVLARKAEAIRRHSSVAGWLHSVAYRLSLKARQSAARRRAQEMQAARVEAEMAPAQAAWRELQSILDEELDRLPEKYRTPFVLCVLEGKSKTEAARDLDWKEGTVSSRLARARTLLQTRLARRGVSFSSLLCGLAIAEQGLAAAPINWSTSTLAAVQSLQAGAGGVSPGALLLAEAFLKALAVSRLKVRLAAGFAVLLTFALVYFTRPEAADAPKQPPEAPPLEARKEPPEPLPIKPKEDLTGKMAVHGKVVGPDGKAVSGAKVAVVCDARRQPGSRDLMMLARRQVLGVGEADGEGRFRLITRATTPGRDMMAQFIARGPKESVGWYSLHTVGDDHHVQLQLEAGQRVSGQLLDHKGKPAPAVTMRVRGLVRSGKAAKAMWMYETLATDAWPEPVVTDAEGKFTLSGLVPLCTVYVEILDARFAPQWLAFKTDLKRGGETIDAGTHTLVPPRLLEGTIRAQDTNEPIANAYVLLRTWDAANTIGQQQIHVRTDAVGRFAIKPYPGKSASLMVCGPTDGPFLGTNHSFDWRDGAERETVELKLPRGVILRGRVVEEQSGAAIAGAHVQYFPLSAKNKYMRTLGTAVTLWRWIDTSSDDEGYFQLAVLPGPGHLLLRGPNHEYVGTEVTMLQLAEGGKGGMSYFPDGLVSLDLKASGELAPVTATLRRGVTVAGRALKADGRPVEAGIFLSHSFRAGEWESRGELLAVKEGRFEIPGCDPSRPQQVYFWDPDSLQGVVASITGKDVAPTVHLKPCASASLRFVDKEGAVLKNVWFQLDLQLRPGLDSHASRLKGVVARLAYPASFIHRAQWRGDSKTGVVTIPELIPGATYTLNINPGRGGSVTRDVSAAAGEHLKIGDIVIEASK